MGGGTGSSSSAVVDAYASPTYIEFYPDDPSAFNASGAITGGVDLS